MPSLKTRLCSQKKLRMDKFVTSLMSRMTLDEKIGQLNLVNVGFDITGPIVSCDVDKKIKSGQVGGVFNTFTPSLPLKSCRIWQ